MTRINIIHPNELTDQHLVAEYREIFMVGSALQRSLQSKNWNPNTIPGKFTLNTGHVKFFYEMIARGMNPDPDRVFKREQWPDELWNDWTPTLEDIKLIKQRIQERIDKKPDWYRRSKYVSRRYFPLS